MSDPRVKRNPSDDRRPKVDSNHDAWRHKSPSWKFARSVKEGRFGFSTISKVALEDLREKLASFEGRTWAQIMSGSDNDHHHVEIGGLSKEAKERIKELRIQEEELFSFRITGKKRLWGVLKNEVYYILFWDPEHEICECKKKHT